MTYNPVRIGPARPVDVKGLFGGAKGLRSLAMMREAMGGPVVFDGATDQRAALKLNARGIFERDRLNSRLFGLSPAGRAWMEGRR